MLRIESIDSKQEFLAEADAMVCDNIKESFRNVADTCKAAMVVIEKWMPQVDNWTAWCMANLTAGERTQIKNIYVTMRNFVTSVNG